MFVVFSSCAGCCTVGWGLRRRCYKELQWLIYGYPDSSYMMAGLCKYERPLPWSNCMSLQLFWESPSVSPSLPSLTVSVWTLCSLCCALQADARPPRSTCRGRRSLSLATGCPSLRPRCGTHLAEVRPERLTSPKPPSGVLVLQFSFSWINFPFHFLVACLLEPVPGDWSFSHFPYSPPPCFCVASWVIVYFCALFDWSLHLLHHSL